LILEIVRVRNIGELGRMLVRKGLLVRLLGKRDARQWVHHTDNGPKVRRRAGMMETVGGGLE
jgi:hypothetical protein